MVTKLVDLTRNTVDKPDKLPKWVWQVEAFVLGIILAIAYKQSDVGQVSGLPPFLAESTGVWAEVVVGLAIGAVSSGFHELFDALSGVAKRGTTEMKG
jgi:hypothetical protein